MLLVGAWGDSLAWLQTAKGALVLTTDAGRHWTALNFPDNFSPGVNQVQFVTQKVGWLQTVFGVWYRTTTGGRYWTRLG